MDNFWFALALTTFAGLSTGVGSAIAFFTQRTDPSQTGFIVAAAGLKQMLCQLFLQGFGTVLKGFGEDIETDILKPHVQQPVRLAARGPPG